MSSEKFPRLTATKTYTISERKYELSPICDIGEFLNSIQIKPYERISVTLKSGIYMWEKCVALPDGCKLSISGEGWKDGGKENKVLVSINTKYSYKYVDGKDYAKIARLIINEYSKVLIVGVNFKEAINDPRGRAQYTAFRGVFNIYGDYSMLYLQQGVFEVSSSPFINVCAWFYGRIMFGYAHFTRIGGESSTPIDIIGVERGANFGGGKALVSCSHSTFSSGCSLGGENVEVTKTK